MKWLLSEIIQCVGGILVGDRRKLSQPWPWSWSLENRGFWVAGGSFLQGHVRPPASNTELLFKSGRRGRGGKVVLPCAYSPSFKKNISQGEIWLLVFIDQNWRPSCASYKDAAGTASISLSLLCCCWTKLDFGYQIREGGNVLAKRDVCAPHSVSYFCDFVPVFFFLTQHCAFSSSLGRINTRHYCLSRPDPSSWLEKGSFNQQVSLASHEVSFFFSFFKC